MGRYRKKPVEIEARIVGVNLGLDEMEELAAWCGGKVAWGPTVVDHAGILIDTLEGQMRAAIGDWIIRGVQGEFYPCKPDIFDATYEPVEAAS